MLWLPAGFMSSINVPTTRPRTLYTQSCSRSLRQIKRDGRARIEWIRIIPVWVKFCGKGGTCLSPVLHVYQSVLHSLAVDREAIVRPQELCWAMTAKGKFNDSPASIEYDCGLFSRPFVAHLEPPGSKSPRLTIRLSKKGKSIASDFGLDPQSQCAGFITIARGRTAA